MDQLAIGQASTSDSGSMALVVSDSSIPGRRDLQKAGATNKEKGSKPDDKSHKRKKKKPVSTAPKGPQVCLFLLARISCLVNFTLRKVAYIRIHCAFLL